MLRSPKSEATVWIVFIGLMSWAFWYCLTTTLDDLTLRDCKAGVTSACQSLDL